MPEQDDASSDEVKDKFREALERKRVAQEHAHVDSADGRKIRGEHGPSSHQRQFRRRSGG
jgi:hypothetical protein